MEHTVYLPQLEELAPYLVKAEESSMRRLLQALLREEILLLNHKDTSVIIPLTAQQYLQIPDIKTSSLNYYQFQGTITYFKNNDSAPKSISNTKDLLKIIKPILKNASYPPRLKNFIKEIDNHVYHEALNHWQKNKYHQILRSQIKAENACSLYDYLQRSQENIPVFFEQYVVAGHPYHPCSKTTMGLSQEEVLQYAPEFHHEVPIYIAALHQEYMHIESGHSSPTLYKEWFFKQFPQLQEPWLSALSQAAQLETAFIPIPLHPWQVQHTIEEKFHDLILKKKLFCFESVRLQTQPTIGFRTVIPTHPLRSPHIKLSVNVQTTSGVRTVSAAAAQNGPRFSRIMRDILKKENYFNNSLRILPEIFGLHVTVATSQNKKHLSAIFRENPNLYLNEHEQCFVSTALFEDSPIANHSILTEIINFAGIGDDQQILDYFQQYANLVINSYLKLYLLYGIALEAHQQNTLVVLKKSRPVATIARDFGNVRIDMPALKRAGYYFDVYSRTRIIAKDRTDACNKLLHTVYQYQLGGWIQHLSQMYNIPEKKFWNIVRTLTETTFESIKQQMPLDIWQEDRKRILEQDWPLKALLRMRLARDVDGYIYRTIRNPLARHPEFSDSSLLSE